MSFLELVEKVAAGSQDGIELFKSAFGDNRTSTDYGFAVYDLRDKMTSCSSNAAEFVDNLWSGMEAAKEQKLKVPSAKFVNEMLERQGVSLRIDPPNLTLVAGDAILLESPTEDADAGDAVPRFVLGEQVGKGGYGVVHRATRTTAVGEFNYAVKILNPVPFVIDHENARKILSLQAWGRQTQCFACNAANVR